MIYGYKNIRQRLCEGYIIRMTLDNPKTKRKVCVIGEVSKTNFKEYFGIKAWYSSDVWYKNPFNQEIKITMEDLNELNAKITVLKR